MKESIQSYLNILNELLLLSIGIAMVVISAVAYNNMNFDTSI
jgi:hypothetical protein